MRRLFFVPSVALAVLLSAACSGDEETVSPAPVPASGGGSGSGGHGGGGGAVGGEGGIGGGGAAGGGAAGSSVCDGCLTFPLDPRSPWPKFRGTPQQNGRSPIAFTKNLTGTPWEFQTGKGIFSSPVVSGDGVVYLGSADRVFYALDEATGAKKWSVLTDEIIDSSALLDDKRRVYFGSGDGKLRALDRDTGDVIWIYEAEDPQTTGGFIRWFEGNVAIGPDGTLYVPNDNFRIYAIDRDTGAAKWGFKTADQTWSLPAVDPRTGALFVGNNNLLALLGKNTFSIDPKTGAELWGTSVDGTIAASPLLDDGGSLMIVGGFDGYLRAYDRAAGKPAWTFGTRDHIYASASQSSDGTIVLPSADGTAYGLHPDGSQAWAFDTLEPLRSSPAIDADGLVYFGSGEGRLHVLNPDGTRRWSIRLIDEDRSDLNSSPALGTSHVILGGENGKIFAVPYDWCLRAEAASDTRCTVAGGEDLPPEGAALYFTTQFGKKLTTPPDQIDGNQPLAFSLFVRSMGDTTLALLDAQDLNVTVDPPAEVDVDVSGDRKFVTIVPKSRFTADAAGKVHVHVTGQVLVNPKRKGLAFSGGEPGGTLDQTFDFSLRPEPGGPFPLPIPSAPGDPAGVWEIYRFAAPLPTILPSYNQIGFDSIHYLIGLMDSGPPGGPTALGWVVGAMLAPGEDRTVVDPSSKVLFPVQISFDKGLVTFLNQSGFTIDFNSVKLPFDLFRAATRVDDKGNALESPHVDVKTVCAGITLYGVFLEKLGFCNPQTDILNVWGAAELRPWGPSGGVTSAPTGVGTVTFAIDPTTVTATVTGTALKAAEHSYGIAIVDAATGLPVALDYGQSTQATAAATGEIASVVVTIPKGTTLPAKVRLHFMVDTYPASTKVVP